MSAISSVIAEAAMRGIALSIDGDDVVIDGEVTDRFLKWATRHKAEILAELRPHVMPSLYPYSDDEDLLDQVRSGIGGDLAEVRRILKLDLADLFSGVLPVNAARHFYQHSRDAR